MNTTTTTSTPTTNTTTTNTTTPTTNTTEPVKKTKILIATPIHTDQLLMGYTKLYNQISNKPGLNNLPSPEEVATRIDKYAMKGKLPKTIKIIEKRSILLKISPSADALQNVPQFMTFCRSRTFCRRWRFHLLQKPNVRSPPSMIIVIRHHHVILWDASDVLEALMNKLTLSGVTPITHSEF